MCDREGIIGKDYPNLNWMQKEMTEVTNLENKKGSLADALIGADIFVGVSAPNIVSAEMVASMNRDAIILCYGKPYTGDHAGCGKGCRSQGRWYRTQ